MFYFDLLVCFNVVLLPLGGCKLWVLEMLRGWYNTEYFDVLGFVINFENCVFVCLLGTVNFGLVYLSFWSLGLVYLYLVGFVVTYIVLHVCRLDF